ncbi:hypothetical protein HBI74_051750 [Parastagonospora nodorum]|nr:hypothetical protein HBI74_051750 [Parastagonospora nodorum]
MGGLHSKRDGAWRFWNGGIRPPNSYLEVAVLLLCLTLAVWYAAGLKDQVKHLKGHVQHLHGKVKEDDKGEKKAQ